MRAAVRRLAPAPGSTGERWLDAGVDDDRGADGPVGGDPLVEAADALYALAPEDFVAARTARARRARADGDRELATAVGALPRPTLAAYLLNQLARRRTDAVRQLVRLGDELRAAHASLEGSQLRALTAQRHQVVAAFARQVAELAGELGRTLSEPVIRQVEQTLRAAVADADAGRALASGRLTVALDYVGLGEVDVSAAVAAPRDRVGAAEPVRQEAGAPDAEDEVAAARVRRREAAVQAVEHAESVARDARAELDRHVRAAAEAEATAEELDTRVSELRAALEQAETAAEEAGESADVARQQRDEAADAVTAAERAVDSARADADAHGLD